MKSLLIGINSKYIHPANGVFQIVANSKSEVSFFEFTIKDSIEYIISKINDSSFDVLLFSVYIWNISLIEKILPLIDSNKIIVLGGPEASHNALYLFTNYHINYIIKNEGEESFNELIEYLSNKRELHNVSNLFYYNDTLQYTYDKCPDINSIKHDYSLIKDFNNRIAYIEASRGCPFKCSYCLASLDNNVRYFPIENIKKDLKYLLDNQAKIIKFLDRSFNINKKYAIELWQFLIDNDNNVSTFQFEINGDLLTKEEISLLQTVRKGYFRFEIGIQSTNDLVNKSINRKQDFSKLKDNIMSIKNNIIIHADLIAGLPYENKNSFINSFNETFLLGIEELQLGFLKELRGTEISNNKKEHGYIFEDTAPYSIISNKYLSNEDLKEIENVEKSLDKFYNKHLFPKTFDYIFNELKLNPYNTFLLLTITIEKNAPLNTLQPNKLAKLFYEALCIIVNKEQFLLFLIKQDYLERNNIKPTIWWTNNISRKERQEYYLLFTMKYPELTVETLYRCGHIEVYNNIVYLIVYHPKKVYSIDI